MSDATAPTLKPDPSQVIRHVDFASRLESACDAHAHAPAFKRGRYSWVLEGLERQGITVSRQTVHQWFKGVMKPRGNKMHALAKMMDVDEAWLALGDDSTVGSVQRPARNALAGGSVNLVAGLIQMAGGSVAFPDPEDARAERDNIHIVAIIRGASYSIHVTAGSAGEDGKLRFPVPRVRGDYLVVLGVVMEGMSARVFELTPDVIATGKPDRADRRGRKIEVIADEAELKPIETFAQRL